MLAEKLYFCLLGEDVLAPLSMKGLKAEQRSEPWCVSCSICG